MIDPLHILAGLGGLSLVLAVWLNHRLEMARLNLPPPDKEGNYLRGFNDGVVRAQKTVKSLDFSYGNDRRNASNAIIHLYRGDVD